MGMNMDHPKKWLAGLVLIFTLSSCVGAPPQSTATPVPATPTSARVEGPRVLISEVLAGMEGNNNYEFIELYNPSATEPIDLDGYTLWYQLEEGKDELILQRWTGTALIPPQGHYLLGRSGEELGVTVDSTFDIPLATSRGGLLLRMPNDEPGDRLGWGADPQRYGEGRLAPAMSRGVSLERKPGGDEGNAVDSGDNRADFVLSEHPQPQGVASRSTPVGEAYLEVTLSAPKTVEPGATYRYQLRIDNQTGQNLQDVEGEIDFPGDLRILSTSGPLSKEGHRITLQQDGLPPGETLRGEIRVKAPWTYLSLTVANYYLRAGNWPAPAFGGPVRTEVAGGSIPISTARSLVGKEVAVEGIATMYTGGYYAGSGNAKFYLEDGSGGLQVWVPEGEHDVTVALGDRVRARGVIELYRGAVELIVNDLEMVEVLQSSAVELPLDPVEVSIQTASSAESLAGRLVRVEGEVVRAEEFNYSYEIDLVGEAGEVLTLYVDKNTSITIGEVAVGDRYRATGILEVRDSRLQLYPRVQRDLAKIYPPILRLTLDVPKSVRAGETFTGTLTLHNHTSDPMTGVGVTLDLPSNVKVVEILDGGERRAGDQLGWQVPEVPGGGGNVAVRFRLQSTGDRDVHFEDAQATAEGGDGSAEIEPKYVFSGHEIPIWAIQGKGFRSPYLLEELTTTGVVTGVFPELGGFWIQEIKTDDDPHTSSGLFINLNGGSPSVKAGSRVRVTGTVYEEYQQTQLKVESLEDIEVVSQGSLVPPPVELDPPNDRSKAGAYFESLEGMWVQISEPARVVAPTSKYGEYTVVLPERGLSRLWTTKDRGVGITVDDGSYRTHEDRTGLAYVVGVGDRVSNLRGPLAYTFGQYKIEPIQPPQVVDVKRRLPSLPEVGQDEFSVATWNVENLFDFELPHPDAPDLPTVSEYKVDVAKVANTILSAGMPTVVGLQEVENIGVLEDVADHPSLAAHPYRAVLVEGADSRGIDVGYLVRGDRAEVLDVEQFVAPEGLTSRPPLLVRLSLDEGGLELYVINNHFTSMSEGELATEPRRKAQAAWVVSLVEEITQKDPQASIAVIGDLNSYYSSPPLDVLRDAGLQHVLSSLPEGERYNYIYQGRSQLLDHILVTSPLMERLVRVGVLHTNADFPLPLPEDTSPLRKSDHDPVIAVFSSPD